MKAAFIDGAAIARS